MFLSKYERMIARRYLMPGKLTPEPLPSPRQQGLPSRLCPDFPVAQIIVLLPDRDRDARIEDHAADS